jgi:pimeloyl-ACP methyl ester carboxylesterase
MPEDPKGRVPDQAGWNAAKKALTLPSGLRLRYVDLGLPDGPPVVLIHGLGDSSRSWSQTIVPLAGRFRLIAPDLRGHGDSETPARPMWTVPELADDVFELARALGVERAAVVGHSLGGFVAQALAINYPRFVQELALIGTAVSRYRESVDQVYRLTLGFGEYPDEEFNDIWCSNVKATDEEFSRLAKEESRAVPSRAWRAAAKGMLASDLARLAREIEARTLIIWGSRDPFFGPEEFAELQVAIPSAVALAYEGHGHNVQWEDPARVGQDLLEFLGR